MEPNTNSLVVITGASSGIGEAMARKFSDAGHALLLLARRLERLKALSLPNAICVKCDITDRQTLAAAIGDAEKKYGPVSCLVNNAGVMLLGQIDTQSPAEWQAMYSVNVMALLSGMQVVLGSMKKRNSGTIINISSVAGRKTVRHHAAYCGTKFAVSAMSENVREEVAEHNVRVITICPGAVETELLSHTTSDDIKKEYASWKKAMGGALKSDDVARAALYAYQQPQEVCVREIVITATGQQT